jgi:tRNA(Ile)-lysidine synthase
VSGWLDTLRAQVEAGPGAGSTLVVATSGGGDSVALLLGLHALREELNLRLVVAHLDHMLRPNSGDDAAFVGQLALKLGLLCLREQRDVAKLAAEQRLNLEEAARRARYAFLEEAGQATRADAIAVAHTADEQAETVLMHLLRGAGLDGLKGMTTLARSPVPGAAVPLFRPLLLVERATLREWLREHGASWREDATNADTTRFRSRLRHHLLPLLDEAAPGARARMARAASVLAADYAWMEAQTEAAWKQVADPREASVRLERAAFLAQPEALQRRLVRRAFFHLRPTARDLSFEQVSEALDVARRGDNGMRATLPGGLFLIVGDADLMIGAVWDVGTSLHLTSGVVLPDEGEMQAEGVSVTVQEVGRAALPDEWQALPPTVAFLDAAALRWPLAMRPPVAGDRWAPLGMGGQTVDLRDWLAKRKVPLPQRDVIPLLVDAGGTILWVVGAQVGEAARVTPATERVIRVTVAHRMLEEAGRGEG